MEQDELLREGLAAFGICLSERQCEQFRIYKDTLLEYNQVMNLTAIEDEREIYTKHFLDSISCLLTGKIKENAKVIDVGTGAGFPSLPIRILREDIGLTLSDSLNKRIRFLQEVCRRMGLEQIEFLHSRAEDAGRNVNYRQRYDIAVARAVATLPVLLEYCTPFLRTDGYFICQKGPAAEEEIQSAKRALSLLGCTVEDVLNVTIPFTDLHHKIILIRKNGLTPKAYPRKAGTPSKQPIR